MKKIGKIFVLAALALPLSVSTVFANKINVSGLQPENYRFFDGFGFESFDYNQHTVPLEKIVNDEINFVIDDDFNKNNTSKYGIVGYSQGGLRVLAYATMLRNMASDPNLEESERKKALDNYNRLGAIITMSGIDKGLKALENNFATARSKLMEDGNIVLNGIHGICKASVFLEVTERAILDTLWISTPADIVDRIALVSSDVARSYIYAAWKGGAYEMIPELYDMVPGSDFIRRNVADTETVTYKRQTGTRKYVTWEKVGWCWWWWVEHTEPEYTTYTVYKDHPKFSSDLPVGYIVGTDNDTLKLCGEEAENNIRTAASVFSTFCEIAQIINHAKCYTTLGIGFLTGHYTAYQNCCTARDWARNIGGEMNDLMGSNENDGLVAKECQFYPKDFYNPATGAYEEVHRKVLRDLDGKGYCEVKKNHASINCDSVKEKYIYPMLDEAGIYRP